MSSAKVPARSLEVTGVSKGFDDTPVLTDITFAAEPGQIIALLGPSGCGKTTLLRTLAGLERPDSGSIHIGGDCVASDEAWVSPQRRRVGMVFQDWALFPHLSVAKNVAYGLPKSERHGPRIDEVLSMVGLDGFGDRQPLTLSGGQQQRVALARALAPRPSVLLLDEPFSNLDSALRVQVRTEVHQLLHDLGITTVFVTHDQEEAFVLGDRVAVMNEGRIEQIDHPNAIYELPRTRWVASFVGKVNFVAGRADGQTAATAIGDIPLHEAANGRVDVLVRPEDLVLDHGDGGVVQLVEYYGHDAMVYVALNDDETIGVRTAPDTPFRRDTAVSVRFRGAPTSSFPAA